MFLRGLCFAVFFVIPLASAARALADETFPRWRVDSDFDPAHAKPGVPLFDVQFHEHQVLVDASVLMEADAQRVWDTSVDYDHYVKPIGMPNLKDNKIVERDPSGNKLWIWSWMESFGLMSKHYAEVSLRRELGGIEWTQVKKREPWKQDEASAFVWMNGSIYISQLSTKTVYVRYFISGKLSSGWPDAVLNLFNIKGRLQTDTAAILKVLEKHGNHFLPCVPAQSSAITELDGCSSPTP